MKSLRILLMALTALAVAAYGLRHPRDNWDMIGYTAAAYHLDGLDGEALRAQTYADVRAETGDRFPDLIRGDYRAAVYADAEALREHLPFYSIKILYVQAMRGLHRLGVPYPRASYAIGAVCAGLSVLPLAAIMAEAGVAVWWLPLIVLLAGFPRLSGFSTPDMMACLAALLAVWAAMRRHWAVFALAVLLPLIRSDAVILSALLLLAEFKRGRRGPAILTGVAAAMALRAVQQAFGDYGWAVIFNFTLIHLDPYPARMAISRDWHDYLAAYVAGARGFVTGMYAPLYAAALAVAAWRRPRVELCALPLAYTALHWLLFPDFLDRFFVFAVSLLMVGALATFRTTPQRCAGR
jgi:hypothetical protein